MKVPLYIYSALVEHHFDYCSIVWANCGRTLSEKLHTKSVELCCSHFDFLLLYADAGYLLQQLGWKDLIAQRQIQVALIVFKALNDLAPDKVLKDSTNKLNY